MMSILVAKYGANAERQTLLFTGGTGFFGRSILRYITSLTMNEAYLPPSITVLTRSTDRFLKKYPEFSDQPWLTFHDGDIMSGDSAFPHDTKFSHVLHAAADSIPSQTMSPLERFDQVVTGTRNTLNYSIKVGARRFLLTSSGSVYGRQPETLARVPETYMGMPDPLCLNSAYGIAKRVAEHLCTLYYEKFGLETSIARCFAFVGPDLASDAHFAIGNFIRDALERPEITVNGDGKPLRSYLYQDDLAEWLLTILDKGKALNAYNVGSDEAISIKDLALFVRDLVSPGKPVCVKEEPCADTITRNCYIPNIDKARSELKLTIRTPLVDAIRNTAFGVGGCGEGYSSSVQ